MKNNLTELMQQARNLQHNMEKAQKELEGMEVIGEAGAGVVRVCLSGRHTAKWVKLAATARDESDAALEELIAAAINDAVRKVERSSKTKMTQLASQLGLPTQLGDTEE